MNDRAVSLLTNYDIEVLRTWKGRGSILCETTQGIKILKEYHGNPSRLEVQNRILNQIKENGYFYVEDILKNKDGNFISKDGDQVSYILKSYFNGRECNVKEAEECRNAIGNLAKLHLAMEIPQLGEEKNISVFTIEQEYEKHNRELKKVKKFIRDKRKKTEFERFLQQKFDYFLEKALQVVEEMEKDDLVETESEIRRKGSFCHGDYQHHNLLWTKEGMNIINFEKYAMDNQVRDLYQFMRKLLEKANWDGDKGRDMLLEYIREKPLSEVDRIQLYYRFAYPEKFWKIVNFYYNTSKSFISSKSMEKLEKLLIQDEQKEIFLEQLKGELL